MEQRTRWTVCRTYLITLVVAYVIAVMSARPNNVGMTAIRFPVFGFLATGRDAIDMPIYWALLALPFGLGVKWRSYGPYWLFYLPYLLFQVLIWIYLNRIFRLDM